MVGRAARGQRAHHGITVAELVDRNSNLLRGSTVYDRLAAIPVGALLRREGRTPHALDRPVHPRRQQVCAADEGGNSGRARRTAVAAGTLLAASSVFGAGPLTDSSGFVGSSASQEPPTGQGLLSEPGTESLAPGDRATLVDVVARGDGPAAGSAPSPDWSAVAFPEATGSATGSPAAGDAAVVAPVDDGVSGGGLSTGSGGDGGGSELRLPGFVNRTADQVSESGSPALADTTTVVGTVANATDDVVGTVANTADDLAEPGVRATSREIDSTADGAVEGARGTATVLNDAADAAGDVGSGVVGGVIRTVTGVTESDENGSASEKDEKPTSDGSDEQTDDESDPESSSAVNSTSSAEGSAASSDADDDSASSEDQNATTSDQDAAEQADTSGTG